MNYISHLTGFFRRVSRDYRLKPTHISLYMALFQQWNLHRFRNPISIAREEVMATARLRSRVTYHKCLRELHAWGYLHYLPSYNHYRGSLVSLLDFDAVGQGWPAWDTFCNGSEQELERGCTGLDPSINKTNPLNAVNDLNRRAYAHAGESSTTGKQASETIERKEKACA